MHSTDTWQGKFRFVAGAFGEMADDEFDAASLEEPRVWHAFIPVLAGRAEAFTARRA
jgi:hypothetical protein